MPALKQITGQKCKTKGQMKNYLDKRLRPALANHRLLNAALSQKVDDWETRLDLVADDPPDKLAEPDFDLYVSTAFVHGHQDLAQQYFESIEELSRKQIGSHAYRRAENKVRRCGGVLENSSNDYDLKLQRYDQAYFDYQEENEDDSVYQQRIAPYKQQLNVLRGQLIGFVTTFNSRRTFDEVYRRSLDENVDYGFRYKYASYAPTRHGWFVTNTNGTYIFDYPDNLMQLHFHYNADRSKVTAVRFKLYGEDHGLDYTKNWGLIEHLTQTYAPVFDQQWHHV